MNEILKHLDRMEDAAVVYGYPLRTGVRKSIDNLRLAIVDNR